MAIQFVNHYADMRDMTKIEDKILHLRKVDLSKETDPFKYLELFDGIHNHEKAEVYAFLIGKTFKEKCGPIVLAYDLSYTKKRFYTIMDELRYYDTIHINTQRLFKVAFEKLGLKYAYECDINELQSIYSKFC